MQGIIKFLKKIVNPHQFTEQEIKQILLACQEDDLDALKKWYEDGKDFSGIIDKESGLSLLMVACKENNTEIVRWLLTGKNGKPLNGIDVRYQITVEKKRSKEILEEFEKLQNLEKDYLKRAGIGTMGLLANMGLRHGGDEKKSNVYHLAAQYSNAEIIALLLSLKEAEYCLSICNDASNKPLDIAVQKGAGETIYQLHKAALKNLNPVNYPILAASAKIRYILTGENTKQEKNFIEAYFNTYKNNQQPSHEIKSNLRKIEKNEHLMSEFLLRVKMNMNCKLKENTFCFQLIPMIPSLAILQAGFDEKGQLLLKYENNYYGYSNTKENGSEFFLINPEKYPGFLQKAEELNFMEEVTVLKEIPVVLLQAFSDKNKNIIFNSHFESKENREIGGVIPLSKEENLMLFSNSLEKTDPLIIESDEQVNNSTTTLHNVNRSA
jgi:hypothetical protein